MIDIAQFLRVHLHSVCSDDLGEIYGDDKESTCYP
jgi:hypothetical protein